MNIYVVQDYDTVEYAGTDLEVAKSRVCGSGCIWIWVDGKITGWYQHEFAKGWVLK